MYIDYRHTQIRMLLSDTSFWCRDAYDVEMVKARNSCLYIPSIHLVDCQGSIDEPAGRGQASPLHFSLSQQD